MKQRFWNWLSSDSGRKLYLDGYIAQESWFADEVSPKEFKGELDAGNDDVELFLNSPGGDVFAASQIYTMLKEYPGKVTVKVESLAASAASVIAMAGDEIQMSPVAMMMIHNPATLVFGEAADLKSGIAMLEEVKESIINAYQEKTKLSRAKLAHMMDAESWFNAHKAVELGFADRVLYAEAELAAPSSAFFFDKATVTNALRAKLPKAAENTIPKDQLSKRLDLIKNWR